MQNLQSGDAGFYIWFLAIKVKKCCLQKLFNPLSFYLKLTGIINTAGVVNRRNRYSPTGTGMFSPVAMAVPKFGEPSAFQVSFCILGVLDPLPVPATLRAW